MVKVRYFGERGQDNRMGRPLIWSAADISAISILQTCPNPQKKLQSSPPLPALP